MVKYLVRIVMVAGALGCQVPEGPDQLGGGNGNTMPIRQPTDGGAGDAVAASPEAGTGGAPGGDAASGSGGTGSGGTIASDAGAPAAPAMWQEHWFEHNQLLKKVADTEDDVIYFDDNVGMSCAGWVQPFVSAMWQYTKKTYGVPGDPRIFVVLHAGRYTGDHEASIFDGTHDFHNVIDIGRDISAWVTPANAYVIAWSAGLLLEKSALGVDTLPSVGVTQTQFGYFFAYDILKAVGMSSAADAWLKSLMVYTVDHPRVGTFWSRDWYYPLWRDHGGAAVFARFIQLVGERYPKVPRDDKRGMMFAPAMNWGEYIHFMSGAAGTDLKSLATKAFGWPAGRDTEYAQAKLDFPTIKY